MKKTLLLISSLLFILIISLSSCIGDKTIKELIITDGLKLEYEKNEIPDFSTVKATIVYNDDTTLDLEYKDLVFGKLDTSSPGNKTLTISYGEYVAYKSVTVKGIEYNPDKLSIINVSLPDSLANFSASKNNFINKNYGYVVGDDNNFYLKLKILAISQDKVPLVVSSYVSKSEVCLGDSQIPLSGDDLDFYVKIDEEKNAFDFTENAIGKTFTISTRPRDITEEQISAFTNSFTVTVVDGYNIYEAYELNYITNCSDGFDFTSVNAFETRNQVQIVDDFLSSEKNAQSPENISSIVIHNHLTIKPTDIPKEYFFENNRNNGLIDNISIYNYTTTDEKPHFSIHGNYFSVFIYNLPNVIAEGGNQDDSLSGAQLFRLTTSVDKDINYDHTNFSVTVNNIHFADDNTTSSDEDKTTAALLGLTAFKTYYQTINLNNVKIEAFLISINATDDYQTINVNDCKFSNSWHNHITLISCNPIQEDNDVPLDKSIYPRLTLNINSSVITKSGGPAIICQTSSASLNKNKNAGPEVFISKDSTVDSWVTGTEAWFTSLDVGIPMDFVLDKLIYPLDDSLQKYNSSFITEKTLTGEVTPRRYFNLVLVNMTLPDLSNGFGDFFNQLQGGEDIDGKVTIGNKEILNMDDYICDGKTSNFKNQTLSDVKQQASLYSLVVHTPSDGVAHTSASDALKVDTGSIKADTTNNYLTVFFASLSIVFGNYHTLN